jgi:hypothetical protein
MLMLTFVVFNFPSRRFKHINYLFNHLRNEISSYLETNEEIFFNLCRLTSNILFSRFYYY